MRKTLLASTASSLALIAVSATALIIGKPVTVQAANYCFTGAADCSASNSGTKIATGGSQALAASDAGAFETNGTFTVANGVTAGAITTINASTTTGTGTVAITSSGGATGTGALGSATNFLGTVSTTGTGTVAFGGAVFANNLTVGSGTTASLAANSTINNLTTATGGVSILTDRTLTVTGGVSAANSAGRTYTFTSTAATADTSGKIVSSANSVDLSGGTVSFNAANTTAAADRVKFTIASSTSGTVTGPTTFAVTNAATGATYQIKTAADSKSLYVVQLKNAAYDSTSSGAGVNRTAVGTYLRDKLAGGASDVNGSSTVDTYLDALGAATANSETQGRIIDQASVQMDTQVASNNSDQFMNVVSDRTGIIQGTKTASAGANGVSSGDVSTGRAVWAQAFGGVGRQDKHGSSAGYDTTTAGFAAGYERKITPKTSLGVSVSYSAGEYESNQAGVPKKTDSDSYQASIYGSQYVTPALFWDAQAGGGFHNFKSTNTYSAGGTSSKGDYDAWGYFGRFGVGYDIKSSFDATVTPYASVSYSGMSYDDYSETGAGGLNRKISRDDVSMVKGSLGARAAWRDLQYGENKISPQLRAAYLYNISQDGLSATTNFIGTGTSGTFKTDGQKQERSGYTVGTGITVARSNGWSVDANYDFEGRSNYEGHSGTLRAKYEF